MRFADIILPLPLYQGFTYQLPDHINVLEGSRVLVPWGTQKKTGWVSKIHNHKPLFHTKIILQSLDQNPWIDLKDWEWLSWASGYYLCPWGEVLSAALPPLFSKHHTEEEILKKKSTNSLKNHWETEKKITLSVEQKKILDALLNLAQKKEYSASLIHGITGSGKTEIYLELIQWHLDQGNQVLYLVPEIGLTPQTISRVKNRFPSIGLYHSGLTENQRLTEWIKCKKETTGLLIGTRSALFAPMHKLGLIILDEEHDNSYKQEDHFRYHTRDMALMRAKIRSAQVVLGSATPSFESYANAQKGKYHYFYLGERIGKARLPKIQVIDMAAQKRQNQSPLLLCCELQEAIHNNLKKKEQSLLLINRRGFARSCFCFECHQGISCPNCSVSLIYHKLPQKLQCHYCDFNTPLPKSCPSCSSQRLGLTGYGSQTIEKELKTFFPKAKIVRLDRDTTSRKKDFFKILQDIHAGKIDIIVGTQMIAKGHDVEKITLVGVMGLDANLGFPDFRAAEKNFQMLTQVAGRAGRGDNPGRVMIQSFNPTHPSIQLAATHHYKNFFELEGKLRQELNYPPFGKLIQFLFQSPSESRLIEAMHQLEKNIPLWKEENIQILGPAPQALAKLRNQFRWHFLMKGPSSKSLNAKARQVIDWMGTNLKNVRWTIDVDPQNML